jgi:hypothetical protein
LPSRGSRRGRLAARLGLSHDGSRLQCRYRVHVPSRRDRCRRRSRGAPDPGGRSLPARARRGSIRRDCRIVLGFGLSIHKLCDLFISFCDVLFDAFLIVAT